MDNYVSKMTIDEYVKPRSNRPRVDIKQIRSLSRGIGLNMGLKIQDAEKGASFSPAPLPLPLPGPSIEKLIPEEPNFKEFSAAELVADVYGDRQAFHSRGTSSSQRKKVSITSPLDPKPFKMSSTEKTYMGLYGIFGGMLDLLFLIATTAVSLVVIFYALRLFIIPKSNPLTLVMFLKAIFLKLKFSTIPQRWALGIAFVVFYYSLFKFLFGKTPGFSLLKKLVNG